MDKVQLNGAGGSDKPARSPSGTFKKRGIHTEQARKTISSVLAYLYDAAAEVPTVYVDEELQTLTAIYG